MTYDPNYPTQFQDGNWQCAPSSAAWGLSAMGFGYWDEWDVMSAIPGAVSSSLGLLDGSGERLRDLWQRITGWPAHKTWGASIHDVAAIVDGSRPALLGGRRWGHWTAVRYAGDGGLYLANPAPNWQGVGQFMSASEFAAWGQPWACVWIDIPGGGNVDEINALREQVAALRAELERTQQSRDGVISVLGYVHGDVLGAFHTAQAGLQAALDAAHARGVVIPDDILNELRGHTQAVGAAASTLDVHTKP